MSIKTGNRLKKVAEKLYDGNQSRMARDMDMSPQAANKYFQGDRDPGIKILKRLVSIGINITWVVAGIPPMLIKDIDQAQVTKATVQNSTLASEMADEFGSQEGTSGKQKEAAARVDHYFRDIKEEGLNPREAELLAEVKQFSYFLETRPLNPHVKRLLLELLIQSIDQAIEQPQRGQGSN